mmetsp:Transcript_4085/g.6939  ORF Transcript_4085/g.6939 Transcript_4085/m.6939 type:complete len:2139 (-) Transcript_4085:201-6617(-)
MQSRATRSDAVRKALLQAKLETGGTVKASPSVQSDYKDKIDRLKSKTKELKSQHAQLAKAQESSPEGNVDMSSLKIVDNVKQSQSTVDTVSEEDEYIRINVSADEVKKEESNTKESEIDQAYENVESSNKSTEVDVSDDLKTDLAVSTDLSESISTEEIFVSPVVVETPLQEEDVKEVKLENVNEVVKTPEKVSLIDTPAALPTPPKRKGAMSTVNTSDQVPEGADFRKSHAVFTVSMNPDMLEVYNVWVPFNCSWDELTEAIQNKVKINSNKSVLKMVLVENTGDILSPDVVTASKFFKIFQNFEAGNSTFVLTIDEELEAKLQAAKDLAAFRAAALRLTFVNNKTKEENFVYLTRSFDWDEILNAIVLEFPDLSRNWISHIIMLDSDGDEISPPISNEEKFWKFTRTASMHNGDVFVFYLNEEEIAADAAKEAEKAFLAKCRPIKLQVNHPNVGTEFTALVPLDGDWEMICSQIAKANPEEICDAAWIVQLLLVDAENDNLSPNIDGDSMFWKVFPTFNMEYDMKFLIDLDATMMEEYARLKALEEYRATAKHLRIVLANDQNSKVGDIYVPHQCEWELLTEGVAEYLNLSTASWIDYFVLLDHEHDPISPPLKNITMFWKACEKFSIEKGMVLNVYLKPEAISTLKELAFLSKANSFCVRLAAPNENDGADSSENVDENRVYVNPDSNWNEMATAMAQILNLDSYEWIENVVLIDEEGDILSPAIKTTEKFWRFYKKSLDKSIFLVNQDEALKAGAIANKRKQEEDAMLAKKEKERLDRAGMKIFHCLLFDHEVNDGSVAPLEFDIRVHSVCEWKEVLQAIDDSNLTESVFVKYLLLADSSGQKLSIPIKDSKMFWKFAPSAEKGSSQNKHFEIHLDYARRTEILKAREEERIRNLQKKIEVAAAIGDQSTTVLLFADASWDDIRNVLIRTCGFSELLEGSCIQHLVLYDIDGDQLSPCLDNADAFWSTFQTIFQFDRNMQFVITLNQNECDAVIARKAHEEFVRNAFKFKLCKKNESGKMKDVLVSHNALWQDVVAAITETFGHDSPTWVHHIVLLDGEGDPLSKNITDTTLFWKTAGTYHYDDNKYFQLFIDNSAVEETRRQQAHEAFMAAAEHIAIRLSPSVASSNTSVRTTGTLHAIFDSPWPTICKAIVSDLNLPTNANVTQCTLIDEDLDELSPSVSTAEKFWKIYKNSFKHDMNMSFSVEYSIEENGDVVDGVDTVNSDTATSENVKISRKEKIQKDKERYEEEVELTKQLASGETVSAMSDSDITQEQGVEQELYEYPDVEIGYENAGASIVRSVKEKEELEAAYLQACVNKNVDEVIELVESEGVNPLSTNKNNSTAAHFACAGGEYMCPVDLIVKLYQYGVDLNSSNVSGARPISCAVIAGDIEACRCLMHYCPQIDLNLSEGTHPLLHHAVDNGNIEMLMWLHEMQVDVNVVNSSGMTAVLVAIEATPFDMDVLHYLVVEMGADINLNAPGNFTAMHAAANTGNIQAADFLYEMGMPNDEKTVDGKTALMFACSQGHLELAKMLHGNGASLYTCGGKVDKLNTSLHLAAQFGHLDIIQWLVEECRLNPSPRNSKNATPADFARAANKMDVFVWLTEWIDAHPDSNTSDEFSEYEQLEETLFRNDFDAAMTLLEEMSDRFTKDTILPHGTTPLHYVAASGYMELAKYLVQMGCDVNVRTNAGRTPLHYASFKGHTDMCMYLFEAGASINETDNGGLTCLKIAEQNNYQSLVLWLRSISLQGKVPKMSAPAAQTQSSAPFGGFFSCMSAAPEVSHTLGDMVQDEHGQHDFGGNEQNEESSSGGHDNNLCKLAVQLHEACILGDLSLAKDLVENEKAPVNGSPTFPNPLLPVDEQELTPLHGAVSSGSLPLVQFLVNKGAHVNAQNVGGLFNQSAGDNSEAMTPLHIACDKQHESIVMYLVSRGADLYKKNMAGDTALHIICLLGLHSLLRQIVDLPRSTLPDLNLDVRSSHLLNLLHCAADAGSIETAEILVENSVGVNSFDDEKKTPMHYACAKGSLELVKLLMNNGAIVDLADTSGRTPFLFACSSDNIELVKFLSERGAQLDHESTKGNTALHIACKFGRLELVQWLVENGLKADHINSSGHSPLYYAQANNFPLVVEWLESH